MSPFFLGIEAGLSSHAPKSHALACDSCFVRLMMEASSVLLPRERERREGGKDSFFCPRLHLHAPCSKLYPLVELHMTYDALASTQALR